MPRIALVLLAIALLAASGCYRIVNGRPLVMRLCGTDLRFDRSQLQTLERFAEELARVRSSSGTRGGDGGSAPSP